jgi:hypothetical protein
MAVFLGLVLQVLQLARFGPSGELFQYFPIAIRPSAADARNGGASRH